MNFIIGVDDFGEVIQQGFSFIDKSFFIKEILDNASTKVTVITRPRRFGKTLNMSMLHHFLASEVNQLHTKGMFDHLKIAQCGSAYMDHQGKYPVISISFKSVSDGGFENAYQHLRSLLQQTYREHRYLMSSPQLHADEKKAFNAILNRDAVDQAVLENSLQELSRLLHMHHGIRPWLLIDEYDTPIQAAYIHGYYDEMVTFMRSMFGNALKGNPSLHRAVVTGILRIAKESLFSGLNNLAVFSILDAEYATCFGFLQAEVDEALNQTGLKYLTQEIKTWYNGYHIGEYQLYNPWSIATCIQKKGLMGPHWVNTGGYHLIKSSMASAGVTAKEKFEEILAGEAIAEPITEHMVFGDLKTNKDALWSLLLFSGYLTSVKTDLIEGEFHCLLKAPNQEVVFLYKSIIREWFAGLLEKDQYHALLGALVMGQLDEFLDRLKEFLAQSSSYFDTDGQHPEKFYHGFVLGLMVSLAETHTIQSNRESGYGRYDVMLIPKDTEQLGLILEFKVAKKDVDLIEAAQEALVQINSRSYETELRQKNIQRIIKIGLAFRGKEVEMAAVNNEQAKILA